MFHNEHDEITQPIPVQRELGAAQPYPDNHTDKYAVIFKETGYKIPLKIVFMNWFKWDHGFRHNEIFAIRNMKEGSRLSIDGGNITVVKLPVPVVMA